MGTQQRSASTAGGSLPKANREERKAVKKRAKATKKLERAELARAAKASPR
jgi:hypothetical protein